EFKTGLIDRFLITCEANDVPPLIVINKMDLAKDGDKNAVQDLKLMYDELGYQVVAISTIDPKSIQDLRSIIEGKTVTLMGPSGTGKTSILNVLNPSLNLTTGEISNFSNKGKH